MPDSNAFQPKHWYWVRRDDGQIVPYVFHRTRIDQKTGRLVADFFVGSFLRSWPVERVIGEARIDDSTS